MARLPTDAVPAAEFIVRHLYRPIELGHGHGFHAVAEQEIEGEDNWFWNDDNAKVLELMSRPEVWRRFPGETCEILRFVRAMCRGPFVFRRVGLPRLDEIGTDGGVTTLRHTLMGLKYDLSRGVVVAGVRFHDERSGDNVMFSANYVEFTYRGRRLRQKLQAPASRTDVARDGHRLVLSHSAEIECDPGWRHRRLGAITYAYRFDASSMVFDVEVRLDLDPAIEVSDVVLTIGNDGLAHCFFNTIVTDRDHGGVPLYVAGRPGIRQFEGNGAHYYAIRQAHISGDALAIHTVPAGPKKLAELEAAVDIQGRLGRVIARYEFPGRHRGDCLVAAERKLITAGGIYDRIADYIRFINEAAATTSGEAARDFSISYDYGATLNALAKCFAVSRGGAIPKYSGGSPGELQTAFDELLQHYFTIYVDRHEQRPNAIFSRECALATLGTATMLRATGADDYRHRLTRLVRVLCDFEMRFDDGGGTTISSFLMRKDSPRAAFVDCHSAVLLALTQAQRQLGDPRLCAVIDRAIQSYGLESCRLPDGIVDTIQTLMIDEHGVKRTENAFWNFKVGLTLRFFAALRSAEEPGLQAIAARHGERMTLLEMVMRRQLEGSIIEHEDGIEIGCAPRHTATNSESQPWTMLGLLGHNYD